MSENTPLEIKVLELQGTPFVVIPTDYKVHSLAAMGTNPTRKAGQAVMLSLDSFCDYVREQGQDSTRIFAALGTNGAGFTAVLDFHESNPTKGTVGKANWGEHRVSYTAEHTVEWNRWMRSSKSQMSQIDFAEFLEENMLAIIQPPGAEVLELVQTLEAKKNVRFDSTQRLANGKTALIFEEDIELKGTGGTNKGKMEFPAMLTLAVPPFVSGPSYKINARLRYRIHDRTMSFWYELVDPHNVVEAVCEEMVDMIEEKTGIAVWLGKPPTH